VAVAQRSTAVEPTDPGRDDGEDEEAAVRRRLAAALVELQLLGVYAAVRIGLFVADVLAAQSKYAGDLGGPLKAWDGNYYLQVAAHGYPAIAPRAGGQLTYSAAGFEPVFPFLIRVVGGAMHSALAGAVVVSVLSGAFATLLVWRLGTLVADERVGWRAAVLFAVFPGMAIGWGVMYCECVGLALAAGCLLLVHQSRWFWAGVLGALATATSPLALALVLAPVVPAIAEIRRRRLPRAGIAVVMIPLGFVAYAGWLGARYHDPPYWWHLQHQAWGANVDFGKSLLLLLPHFWSGGYQGKAWMEWIGIAAVVGAVYSLWRAKLPGYLNAYCGGVFFMLFVSNSLGFKPRLLAWAFPTLIAVAIVLRNRTWQALAVLFAGLVPIVFLAYTTIGNVMIQP